MRHLLLVTIFGFLLTACAASNNSSRESDNVKTSGTATAVTETQKLNQWFEIKYEEELMMSPIELTFQGRKERYGEIDDLSEAAADKQLEWKRQTVEEMTSKFAYEKLSADGKISYDLWKHQYETAAQGDKFKRNAYIFEQMNGTHSFLPTFLMSFHEVTTLEHMQAFVSRVSGVGRAIRQLNSTLRLVFARHDLPMK